jgi:hypothetical protein
MNKKAEPPPVAVKETVAPVAPSAPERQPAALKNQNSSKNKKKR